MASLRSWLDACRPKTLVAAAVPVAVGGAVYWNEAHHGPVGFSCDEVLTLGCCLGFALGAQIASNFANDLGDALRGADNVARIGPRRAVSNGLISAFAMRWAIALACALAFLAGTPLGLRQPVLFLAGSLALVLALGYTLGPLPLAYLGLGDIFVVGCFGIQATTLTVYALHTSPMGNGSHVPWSPALLSGLGLGLLADNILLANNARDKETDTMAGKRTTVVRFGYAFAKNLHAFNILVGLGCLTLVFGWVVGLLLPLGLWQHWLFRKVQAPLEFVPFLGRSALLLLLVGLLCVTATCLGWASSSNIFGR